MTTYTLNTTFNGDAPTSPAPWLTATFETVAPGEVQLTLQGSLAVASEFFSDVAFNVDPSIPPSDLIFSQLSGDPLATVFNHTSQNAQSVTGGGAAGSGFDVDVEWATSGGPGSPGRFDDTDTVILDIKDPNAPITASSFDFTNTGSAAAHVAAHVQGIPLPGGGTTSGAIKDGPVVNSADLSIDKSDGKTTAVPGEQDTYTITVLNKGPSTVGSFNLADVIPAGLLNPTFSSPTSGSFDPATGTWTGTLASRQSVSIELSGTIDPAATGSLTNTATVSPPAGITDPDLTNNTATDTDTLTPQGDLSIVKDDGKTTVVAGKVNSYTITVANTGPSTVVGAQVADGLPTIFTSATWTSVASAGASHTTPSGSGNIADTVTMAPGSFITYTLTGTVSAGATGTLANTATVTAPSGFTDTNPSNNSSTDTDTIFTPGPSGLTIGYWFNHQSAWYIPPGGVKGDVLLGDKASPIGGQPLFVPKDAATQLINSSQSANDTRQTLISQAEATQLNLGNGAQDPGSLTPGHDLISEAVYWLEGRSLTDGSPSFIYSDTSSGNTDATHNGRVDTAAGGTYPTSDYNSTSRAFTFEGADGFQVPGKALTSSSSAWQQFVDTGIKNPLTSSDFLVTGQGLKNALQAFNQGQLVTSANGQQVAWISGGTYSDFHTNDAAGMWTVLKDNGVAGIS